jgi:hypothetical protein
MQENLAESAARGNHLKTPPENGSGQGTLLLARKAKLTDISDSGSAGKSNAGGLAMGISATTTVTPAVQG